MPLKFAGNCTTCGVRVEQRQQAWYDAVTKVTCTNCRPPNADSESAPAGSVSPAGVPMRSARTDREKGTELEQHIAAVFTGNGYSVTTNVIREGHSGASHEIDVLAEKSDSLLTLSVFVECKAWASPIDKSVVIKADHVRRDLRLGHALVVPLNGATPDALKTADDLGVAVWGASEIEVHLGRVSVQGLQNRPMVHEVGFPRLLLEAEAQRLVERESAGRFGIGKEEIITEIDAWIPASTVHLNVWKVGPLRKTATRQMWTVYDLVTGTLLTRLDEEPTRAPMVLDGPQVKAKKKVVEPSRALDDALARFDRAKSDNARQACRAELSRRGIPDLHLATTGDSWPFLYPVHLALVRQKAGTERIIAVDSFRSRVDIELGVSLSKMISWVTNSFRPTR